MFLSKQIGGGVGIVENTLLERVEEFSRQKSERDKGSAVLFVKTHRDEIRKVLDNGHDVKALWKVLHQEGRITCSYGRFNDAIKKYFSNKNQASPVRQIQKIKPVQTSTALSASSQTSTEAFVFNPTPKKEDLY